MITALRIFRALKEDLKLVFRHGVGLGLAKRLEIGDPFPILLCKARHMSYFGNQNFERKKIQLNASQKKPCEKKIHSKMKLNMNLKW